jgi:hypothetical protein
MPLFSEPSRLRRAARVAVPPAPTRGGLQDRANGSPPNQSRYESARGALHVDRGPTVLVNMLFLCRQALHPPGSRSLCLSEGIKSAARGSDAGDSGQVSDHHPAAGLTTHWVCLSRPDSRLRGASLLRSRVYEITFEGRAGSAIRAAFDDCEVSVGQDTTTLRVGLPDPAALWRIVERMIGLGLNLIEMRLVAVPSAASGDGSSQALPAG